MPATSPTTRTRRRPKEAAPRVRPKGDPRAGSERSEGGLRGIREKVRATKMQIAAIRDPCAGLEGDKLHAVLLELDAVIAATQDAAHGIIAAAEELDGLTEELRAVDRRADRREISERMVELTVALFEQCTFQDIAGQRLAKAIAIIGEVDRRLAAVIDVWGVEEFRGLAPATPTLDADAALLAGPATGGGGLRQADVDEYFR